MYMYAYNVGPNALVWPAVVDISCFALVAGQIKLLSPAEVQSLSVVFQYGGREILSGMSNFITEGNYFWPHTLWVRGILPCVFVTKCGSHAF